MTAPHRRRTAVALAGGGLTALLTALLTASPGAASLPSAPTLVPPPPDGYTCQPTGGGTICHRRMDFTHQAAYDATCPQGFDILENGAVTELGPPYLRPRRVPGPPGPARAVPGRRPAQRLLQLGDRGPRAVPRRLPGVRHLRDPR